jgi:hypothetical protein
MEYFVSAENTPYYQWQLELLIESFKQKGLENNLVIGLAHSDQPAQADFCRNLYSHKRIFPHENIGKVRGYPRMNGLYSLHWAVLYGIIKQPFVYIEADMVLNKPMNITPKPNNICHLIFCPDPFFTEDFAEENMGNFKHLLNKAKTDYQGRWPQIGSIIYFNNTPPELFSRAIMYAEILAYKQIRKGRQIWSKTDRAAWAINLSDCLGSIIIAIMDLK